MLLIGMLFQKQFPNLIFPSDWVFKFMKLPYWLPRALYIQFVLFSEQFCFGSPEAILAVLIIS
jgi:hypothetical protein